MVVVPMSTFFYARSLYEYEDPYRDLWPPIAAVVAVWLVIAGIIVWKYFEDFKSVFWDGTGDIPYDPDQRALVAEIQRRIKAQQPAKLADDSDSDSASDEQ